MPEISLFFGIRVTINYNDHVPPHFYAEYNGNKVLVDIINVNVLKGYFPKRQLKLILAWAEIHKDELQANWKVYQEEGTWFKIDPIGRI